VAETYSFHHAAWTALHTAHSNLALRRGSASKYPADVAPFAAVTENTLAALENLRSLLTPGEAVWLAHDVPPATEGLRYDTSIPVLQMRYPLHLPLPKTDGAADILPLDASHAAEMVALTDVAFPGFFRARTHVMGSYFGVRDNSGKLVAMGGERMIGSAADGGSPWREISGLCTHPESRGHGYASLLLRKLIEHQRALHADSVLHVTATNANAVALYRRLGFEDLGEIKIHRIVRD
jgi:GNAT superfamily N-acetyltransferase